MPIACECPECGKRLKAADSAAGMKAKCPDCGGAVCIPARTPVPELEAEDEFDLQRRNPHVGWEGPIADDQISCPMCGEMIKAVAVKCRYCGENLGAPQGQRRGNRGRSSGGLGLPATVIVALIVEVLFMLLNVVGIFGNLAQSNVGGAVGSVARILIEVVVFAGLWSQKELARTGALVLSGLGIVLMFTCGGFIILLGEQPQIQAQFPDEVKIFLFAALAVQVILYVAQIAMLVTGSAKDYLDQ